MCAVRDSKSAIFAFSVSIFNKSFDERKLKMRQTIILTVLCGLLALSLSSVVFATEINFTRHVIASGYPSDPCQIRAIDMDHDSDMDLVTASTCFGAGHLSWWQNDGSQNFVEHAISGDDNFWEVEVADMDSDGDWDILVMRSDEPYINYRVTVWVNDGYQNFTAHDIATPADYPYLYAIDLDDDGDTDIIARKAPQSIVWLENQGNLSFAEHVIEGSFEGAFVYAADLDSDSDVDVIGWSRSLREVRWWENDGNQNFTGHLIGGFSANPLDVRASDLDNDGDVDLLVGFEGYVSALENDGSQSFSEHVISTNPISHPNSVYIADLDDDGDGDALAASYWGTYIRWFENEGNFSFTEHTLPGAGSFSVRAVDLDRDDDLDVIAVVRFGREIAWWENISMEVRVTLTPHNPPIQIPPQGGRFSYDGVVTNSTNAGVTVDAWTMVFLPTGHRLGPKKLFQDLDLAPYGDTSQTISHRVKRWAPPGEYTYVGYVGYYPDTKLDSSYFNFTKLESKDFASGEAFAVFDIFGEELEFELLGTALLGAYPSPFNIETNITYDLAQAGPVRLEIFNIQGGKVGTLVDAEQSAGRHSVTWDASEFSSGVYFYKLTTADFTEAKRMTLLK